MSPSLLLHACNNVHTVARVHDTATRPFSRLHLLETHPDVYSVLVYTCASSCRLPPCWKNRGRHHLRSGPLHFLSPAAGGANSASASAATNRSDAAIVCRHYTADYIDAISLLNRFLESERIEQQSSRTSSAVDSHSGRIHIDGTYCAERSRSQKESVG